MKKITLSLLVPTAVFFVYMTSAHALTIARTTMYNPCCGMETAHLATIYLTNDKGTYTAGETITITTTGTADYDAGALQPGYLSVTAQQMDITNTGVPPYLDYMTSGDIPNASMPYSSLFQEAFFPIPGATAPGDYNLDVRTVIYSKNSSYVEYANSGFDHKYLPYTVAAPSVTVDLCFSGPCP